MTKTKWQVKSGHRYDYWALDIYKNGQVHSTMIVGLKRKQAETLEWQINELLGRATAESPTPEETK
jgi:hypothetical protein